MRYENKDVCIMATMIFLRTNAGLLTIKRNFYLLW